MPIISIIIPCFNSEAYVAETLESVLAQTIQEWEVLLVNDGSRDGTQGVLDRYVSLDSRIRCLTLPANLGIPAARNLGTAATTGRCLMHLDSDDLLLESVLEQHLDVLQAADVSCMGYDVFDTDPLKPFAEFKDKVPADALSMLTTGSDKGRWWTPPGAVVVRREADTKARQRFEVWPRQIPTLTESHYYACLYQSGAEFVSTERVGLHYRKHPYSDGATATYFDLASSYRWMLDYWIKAIPDHPELLRRKAMLFESMQVAVNVETAFLAKHL